MDTTEFQLVPNSRLGVDVLIPQVCRDGTVVKVDVYGGETFEADALGTVAKLENFSGTLTFRFSSMEIADSAEKILEIMRDEDKPVTVRSKLDSDYGSITDPVTGMRVSTGLVP